MNFVGSALARFERSTLLRHKGTRAVVLRFLKIITPLKCVIPHYDGYICCPEEGKLHQRPRKNACKIDQSVWGVNIDNGSASFNYFGMRSLCLFDAIAKLSILSNAPCTLETSLRE